MLLREIVERNRYCFHRHFDTWEESIQAACAPLLADGSIEQTYADAIITSVREFGPYIVFAPNIAMPHAQRGGEGVNATAVSLMKVEEPVHFQPDSPDKDARLFFTVCATDKDIHLENMERLAELLMTAPGIVEDLLRAKSAQDLLDIDTRYFAE